MLAASDRRVYVVEPEGPEEWFEELKKEAEVIFLYPEKALTPEEVRKVVSDATAMIITSRCGVSAEDMEHAKSLGIISKCGAKPSNVDIDAATKKGIAVTFTPGANSTTVAEFAVMMMMACLRRLNLLIDMVAKDEWRSPYTMGRELRDKVVGLIGYGAIGREVARRLEGYDCQVLAYDPYYKKGDEPKCVTFIDDLKRLITQSDVISIHCMLTDETYHLLSDKEFAMMKPTAVVVNTARGPIIDEEALARALKEEKIWGAAIDVYAEEPAKSTHPLVGLKNAILTPHVAGWTEETIMREVGGAVKSVLAYLRGEEIPGLINPDYAKHRRA